MPTVLKDSKGTVLIEELDGDNKRVSVEPDEALFIPVKTCETNYPVSLIRLILDVKGLDYLCDEICREAGEDYVRRDLEADLKGYFPEDFFRDKRILDFGCGSGASSMVLSRMFPDSEIVGVELEEKHLEIARARLAHYGYKNIEFHRSPSGNELPPAIGKFDLVILSAVYEHLLPEEREKVLPLIWSAIKPGGYLFLNMTPYRWFPIEHHTTGLPFLNYLPKTAALPFARAFSNRIDKSEPWEILLRRGIRGGTEGEILKILNRDSEHRANLIEPEQQGNKDRIDLWFSQLSRNKHVAVKRGIKTGLKVIKSISGMTLVPNLSLVINKSSDK